MTENERKYVIPLRREFIRAPAYRKTPRAVKAVRNFISKHMKVDESKVKIGKHLNLAIWAKGIKNPPAKVKVTATKSSEGIVTVELSEIFEKKKETKHQVKSAAVKRKKEEKAAAPEAETAEEAPEEKPADKPE